MGGSLRVRQPEQLAFAALQPGQCAVQVGRLLGAQAEARVRSVGFIDRRGDIRGGAAPSMAVPREVGRYPEQVVAAVGLVVDRDLRTQEAVVTLLEQVVGSLL